MSNTCDTKKLGFAGTENGNVPRIGDSRQSHSTKKSKTMCTATTLVKTQQRHVNLLALEIVHIVR